MRFCQLLPLRYNSTFNIQALILAIWITCLLLIYPNRLLGDISKELLQDAFNEGVFVDLRNPSYQDGVLTSTEGGVITGPNIRIQAMKMFYTRKTVEDKLIFTITAEDKVMVEFGTNVFIGDFLEYDFQTKSGYILRGKTALEPWYLGGERLDLLPDGNYAIHQGYLTTAENDIIDWKIATKEVWLSKDFYLKAKQVRFWIGNTNVFSLPSFSADLNTFFDSPIRYTAGTGGRQGPRVGIIYEFYSTQQFKAFFRLDYRVKRGFRGGIETKYNNVNQLEWLYTINYLARDTSLYDPHEKIRYRFYGLYHNQTASGRTSLHLTYDKVSDNEMPSDYNDQGIEFKEIKKTQVAIRHQQNENWISNLITHVRINPFQTIKQELPSWTTNFHPITLGSLGIISDSQCKTSYLSYKYDNDLHHINNFHSSRLEMQQKLYRPFFWGPLAMTPEIGFNSIYYGSSPNGGRSRWLTLGTFKYSMSTRMYRPYSNGMHMIIPYTRYTYDTFPTVSPNSHYIFDLHDGWYRLNMLRFGVQNLIYLNRFSRFAPYLTADLYSNAFFGTPTIPQTIPKAYLDIVWDPTPFLRYSICTGWDLKRNIFDHLNIRKEFTFSEDLALALEWRHRSAYDWRKAVHCNYILDSFRSEKELFFSPLSDRRDTFLMRMFYRFRPTWALEIQSRQGSRRRKQWSYFEYQIDLTKTIHSAWHLKLSYQNQESDKRVAFSAFLDLYRPCEAMKK